MKKQKMLFAILITLLILVLSSVPVSSAEYEYKSGETGDSLYPQDEMEKLFESLPEDVRNQIKDYELSEDEDRRRSALRERLDLRYWLSIAADTLGTLLFPAVGGLASLLCIVIAGGLAGHIVGVGHDSGIRQVYRTVVSLATAVSVTAVSQNAARSVSLFISNLTSMMNAMLPVMNAVMLTSGTPTQMSVSSSALMLYITVTENLTHIFLIPASGALLALTAISSVFREINITGFIESAKKIIIAALGISVTVFSFILGIQTSLARGTDGLAARTVKFAVGSYIPIVGGAVSDALSTVGASLSLIRRTTGGIGIVIILLLLLPQFLSLMLTRLTFSACRLSSDILGAEETSGIIRCAGAVIEIFCASAALSAIMFIFAVTLFMNSGLT